MLNAQSDRPVAQHILEMQTSNNSRSRKLLPLHSLDMTGILLVVCGNYVIPFALIYKWSITRFKVTKGRWSWHNWQPHSSNTTA